MDHHNREVVNSSQAPEPVGAYPHATRAGDLLFLSGIGPRSAGSTEIPGVQLDDNGDVVTYDIAAQCRACFENAQHVMDAAGAPWTSVVDVLVFLTNIPRDFDGYNEVYKEYFSGPGNPNPSRTTIEVSRLPQGGDAPIAVEIKITAMLPS